MKRLTLWYDGYCGTCEHLKKTCSTCPEDCALSEPCEGIQNIVDRLAAYEDTGLEPGQVRCIMGDTLTLNLDDETAQDLAELIESAGPRPIFQATKFNEPNIEFMFAWIRTDEMLPPVGEPVLIVRHSYNGEPVRVEPATLRPNGTWQAIGHKFTQKNVSHWMPMPVPPQEGEICHT